MGVGDADGVPLSAGPFDQQLELFSDKRRRSDRDQDQLVAELYQQVGQLTMELDWLKKKSVFKR